MKKQNHGRHGWPSLGAAGLHRFYLHGFWDLPGWLLPAALGAVRH